jgi:hypothetical protein
MSLSPSLVHYALATSEYAWIVYTRYDLSIDNATDLGLGSMARIMCGYKAYRRGTAKGHCDQRVECPSVTHLITWDCPYMERSQLNRPWVWNGTRSLHH